MTRLGAIGSFLCWMTMTAMIGCVGADAGDDDTTEQVTIEQASGLIDVAEVYTRGGGWSSRITGQLNDGPDISFHRVAMEQGECVYYELQPGLCESACEPDQACNAQSECQAYPGGLSGGTLTVSGVGDPVVIEP